MIKPFVKSLDIPSGRASSLTIYCGSFGRALSTVWLPVGPVRFRSGEHPLKLAALVPPPRLNLVRYHGVLAPNAGDRDRIVPGSQEAPTEGCSHAEQCPSSVAALLRTVDARTCAISRARFPCL